MKEQFITKISVFIITKNEADRIARIIKAAKPIADEILVIDSGSTDNTYQIAQELGATVIFNQWQGYGPQKVFGENQCRNKWILNIDADEEITPELTTELHQLLAKGLPDHLCGYRVKIVNIFPGENKPKKFAYYYNQFRLYNRDFAGFSSSTIHDSVLPKNANMPIGQLKNVIAHQSFRSYSHWIEKMNSYSQMQAQDAIKKNKTASILRVILTPIIAFFKAYFVRRYFIYGFNGFIYSYLFALSRLLKLVKIREAKNLL